MNKKQKIFSRMELKKHIKDETYYRQRAASDFIIKSLSAMDDTNKEQRLVEQLCIYCFYFGKDRVCFQAITFANCSICDEELTFANSCIDKICKNCAIEHEICIKCMAEISYICVLR